MTINDKSFLVFIHDKMLEDPFDNVIQNQLKNSNSTICCHGLVTIDSD
jgi:hypothetical protein